MSRPAGTGPGAPVRALMILAAVIVVLVPIIGLKLLARDDPDEVSSATGSVTLTAGNRMIYVLGDKVASLSLAPPGAIPRAPVVSDLLCARVYAANGTGICLRRINAVAWSATVLDRHLEATATHPMAGEPLLARISPSGRMVAWTTLTAGTSLGPGAHALTTLVDTDTGATTPDLSAFAARSGETQLSGHQVWGVSFVDDDRFYATLAVGGERYLVLGSVGKRTLEAVATGVTNPAVSPDATRLAFVHTTGDAASGRLAVMDLKTGQVTDLRDTRGVVDQPTWLGPELIAYVVRSADGTPSIWTTGPGSADRAALLQDQALSPSPL